MIRDPSDGTSKEKSLPPSALPQPKINAEELARLERARKWLKDWIEGKR